MLVEGRADRRSARQGACKRDTVGGSQFPGKLLQYRHEAAGTDQRETSIEPRSQAARHRFQQQVLTFVHLLQRSNRDDAKRTAPADAWCERSVRFVGHLDVRYTHGDRRGPSGRDGRRIALLERSLRHVQTARGSSADSRELAREPPAEERTQRMIDAARREYIERISADFDAIRPCWRQR